MWQPEFNSLFCQGRERGMVFHSSTLSRLCPNCPIYLTYPSGHPNLFSVFVNPLASWSHLFVVVKSLASSSHLFVPEFTIRRKIPKHCKKKTHNTTQHPVYPTQLEQNLHLTLPNQITQNTKEIWLSRPIAGKQSAWSHPDTG